jgi:hypothetical protein
MPVNNELASEIWYRYRYCLSGDSLVLTTDGFVPLCDITSEHLIFDGVEFVKSDGAVYQGRKVTMTVDDVRMTPDHRVLDKNGAWVQAQELPDLGRGIIYTPVTIAPCDVYDVLNCGPRRRFAVKGATGLLICHNCAERSHYDFLVKADRCEKFFKGEQWSPTDLAVLNEQRRPALTINKINGTVSTLQGEQIINRSEVLFRPAAGGIVEVADALSKVWMQIAQNNQLQWVRSQVFDDGIIRSRGFYDVRLDFSDSMLGEVRITNLNSKNVIIDPDAEEYDPDAWNDVFITKWMTYQDVAILYDEDDAEALRDRDISTFPYAYDSIDRVRDRFSGAALQGSYYGIHDEAGVRRNIRTLERQYHKLVRQKHFVDTELGDTRPIPDGWDRNRIVTVMEKAGGKLGVINKLVKRIRWTVTADNVVLHDDWSPFKHFTVVPYFPQFRYGSATGIVEHLLGPQEMLNKVSSQELHVVNTTANSGWKVKAGALKNMAIEELEQNGATTGLVLELDDINNAEKIQPNQTPQGLDRLSYKAEEHIKTISNVSDSMQGFDREDVAAKAIAYKQQRSSVTHSKTADNLERSDFLLARNVLDIVQEYYTEPRLIRITGDDSTHSLDETQVNAPDPVTGAIVNDLTLGEYTIVVSSTPARATLEDTQFEQALGLRKEGVPIPDDVLIENSRLMRRSEIIKRMQAASQSPEAQQQAQLQMRQLAASVAKLEAEAQRTQAETQQKTADAQKKVNEAQGQGDPTEIARAQAELALEQRRLEAELQAKREELEMKREELAMRIEMERERHTQDMAFRQQEHRQNLALRQQQVEQQVEQQASQQRDRAQAQRASELREQSAPVSAPTTPTKE